jgi:hypothetical protein
MTTKNPTVEYRVCREPHLGTLDDGTEYVCRAGALYRADSEQVRRQPQYFLAVGEQFTPFEREEPPEEPPRPPKPPVKMLRSRKDWRSDVIENPTPFGTVERLRITLHEGKSVRADTEWLKVLTAAQRRELFEVVEP